MTAEKKFKDPLHMREIRAMLDVIDRPIAFRRALARLTGSVQAALMLSQAIYWQERAKQPDDWWYKTARDWEKETGLSLKEYRTARRNASKYLSYRLKGVPARLFWKVNAEALIADLTTWLLKNPPVGNQPEPVGDAIKDAGEAAALTDLAQELSNEQGGAESAPCKDCTPQILHPQGVQNQASSLDEKALHDEQNGQASLSETAIQFGQNGQTSLDEKAKQGLPLRPNFNTEITTETDEENRTEIIPHRAADEINANRPEKQPSELPLQQLEKDFRQVLPEEDPAVLEEFLRKGVERYPGKYLREALIQAIKYDKRCLQGVIEVLARWERNGRN